MEHNALRDAQKSPSKKAGVFKRIVELPKIITRPSAEIIDGGQRRRARFLRTALFAAVCVFPILQYTSDPVQGIPFYSVLAIYAAGVYLLSGTTHLRLSSALTIICAACIPIITISLQAVWTRGALAFQILTWPVLSVLIATQLISIKKQALLAAGLFVALLILSISRTGILFTDAIEALLVYIAIAILLMFTSWNQDYYSNSLERSNRNLEARRKELEIYTSLLRHDLGNDVQMILGGIELSQMSNGEPKQAAFLESTYAAAHRMRSLLHIFSISEVELDADIVTVLEKIGKRAEVAFKGMRVSFNVESNIRQHAPKYGRLIALAFENLLRNAAQHAGDCPNVEINVFRAGENLEVLFSDDGSGVSPEIQENLFEKGITTGPEGKGLGLYLSKTIIESEDGSINLIKSDKPGCCFSIKLPWNDSD